MEMMRPMMGLGMVGLLLLWLGFIALVVWIVYLLISRSRRPSDAAPYGRGQDDALEIAKRRYAKGQISREEFEAIKRELA